LLPLISDNIIKLIKSSIHHKDLHPGNIIIDKSEKPFVLDFDKAYNFRGSKEELADRYIQRWQRAIKKYNLPEELLEIHL
ncbi:MAG: hypothetical protein KAJ62_12185, partial [Desulfobacteraceae bacterium]|nr:hypothetical protein [Desulfobacteraceae bacterium]